VILPTRKFLYFLAAPVALLLVLRGPTTVTFVVFYDIALVVLALVDLAISARPRHFHIERQMPSRLSLGALNMVGWELHNRSPFTVWFEITEDVPVEMEREASSVSGQIVAHARAELRYSLRPTRRGLFEFGDIHLRYRSALGLLLRQKKFPVSTSVKVYPNVANLSRYEMALHRHRLAELGLSAARQRGKGMLFESLRDYVPGDDLADIAWKATARRGRPITRNFETDRSQNILVVVDCGRLMTTQVDNLSRLDYAVNAALLLTYVAVRQGDYIGMVAFSDRIEGYVPPMRGKGAITRMNEALYRLEPRLREPNYEEACRFLALRHRKRSLIVIITDVIDKDASSMLLAYTARFARRHLPLCVTLRNLEVDSLAGSRPTSTSECFTKAVALEMLAARNDALARMRQFGVDVLDVNPRQLSPKLLNRYLWLKQRMKF
jgi:uncharacterized protein (DUF58 family)